MPNRYIRASAIESEAVNALSWRTEVFWRRLLNRVDDFGRFTANPALIRAACFPLQSQKISEPQIVKMLEECQSVGLLFLYHDNEGKPLLVMNKWERGRARKSEYADPPANICELMQTYVYTRKHMSPTPTPTPTPTLGRAAGAAPASDSEWLAEIAKNPAYEGINVGAEYGKMQAWCGANRKAPTRRRFVAWLNRCERPMQRQLVIAPARPAEPPGWREKLNQLRPDNTFEGSWAVLPAEMKQLIQANP